MVDPSKWSLITQSNPDHSRWYVERFRAMAAAGDDLAGEARFIDALAPREARILDAGCGPGRVGAQLAAAGHEVVGIDVDQVLIEAAQQDHPGPTWLVGDLAELDLATHGIAEPFDVIASVGNVFTFLAPSTRRTVLSRLCDHLGEEGRIVIGFGAGRDYDFDDFRNDVAHSGLISELELATWDLRPFHDEADFLVSVLARRR